MRSAVQVPGLKALQQQHLVPALRQGQGGRAAHRSAANDQEFYVVAHFSSLDPWPGRRQVNGRIARALT
ncbi:hypothetical protein D3C74_476420 [compost metagenome]